MKINPVINTDAATQKYLQVMTQREEIITAFIAKYGCQPEDIVQVTRSDENCIRWYVTRRDAPQEEPTNTNCNIPIAEAIEKVYIDPPFFGYYPDGEPVDNYLKVK